MQVSTYMERLKGGRKALCKKASRYCKEKNFGDNIKDHGHTLLENYPECGLRRCEFCTISCLYKMAVIQLHGDSQHYYSRMQQRDAEKRANASHNLEPRTYGWQIADYLVNRAVHLQEFLR